MHESRPDPVRPAYDEQYFRETYRVDGLRRFGIHWWSVRWYADMTAWCLQRAGGRRVLEIGCGHGFALARLESRYETWGVDISAYAIEQAARFAPRSRCMVADVEQGLPAALAPGSFDVIVAKYVLEHLREPGPALRRIAAQLRPGGLLMFAVPHTGSLGARRKGADWYAHKDPTHCSLLSRDEWLRLTREAGLLIDRETADGWWDVPYFRGLPGWAQLPLFIAPTAVACLARRPVLPAGWGENVIVFARKPLA
jgi:SAM-dependent methyltransferase